MSFSKRFVMVLPWIIFTCLALVSCGGGEPEYVNNTGGGTGTGGLGSTPVNDGVITLEYVGATNTQVGFLGQGTNQTSILTFRAADSSGNAVSGQAVNFSLSNTTGGISLLGIVEAAETDLNGNVSVTLQSGTSRTTVSVSAVIAGTDVKATSDGITVTSGIVDSNRFDLSVDIHNKESTLDHNGIEVQITVHAADRFGSPAFDGTAVNFVSPETGVLDNPPSCELINGSCSVTWESAGSYSDQFNGDSIDRYVTILATVQGEEYFIDLNGNNVPDPAEDALFDDISEPYADENENGVYDAGEFFLDENANGVYDSEGNGTWDGPCLPGDTDCLADSFVTLSQTATLYLCPTKIDGQIPECGCDEDNPFEPFQPGFVPGSLCPEEDEE